MPSTSPCANEASIRFLRKCAKAATHSCSHLRCQQSPAPYPKNELSACRRDCHGASSQKTSRPLCSPCSEKLDCLESPKRVEHAAELLRQTTTCDNWTQLRPHLAVCPDHLPLSVWPVNTPPSNPAGLKQRLSLRIMSDHCDVHA